MPRKPLETYERFIDAAARALGHEAPEDAVPQVRRALRGRDPEARRALEPILASLSVSASYVASHLLSIPSWPREVRDALRDGLPLAKARRIARAAPEDRAELVAAALGTPPPTDAGGERPIVPDADGWIRPSGRRRTGPTTNLRSQDTWIYPSLAIGKRRHEVLHPALAASILRNYARPGDRIVDLTAGAGTIAQVARDLELLSWSGDLHPRAPFVHACDARTPLASWGLREGCADLVVLHPPTFNVWREGLEVPGTATWEAYQEFVADLVAGASGLLRPGAHLILVTRAVRTGGTTIHSIGPLIQVLEDTFGRLHRHHVAIETMARKHWDVLVGRDDADPDDGTSR